MIYMPAFVVLFSLFWVVAGPEYPRQGVPTQKGIPTYNLANFSLKLHENENNWAERRVCVPVPPINIQLLDYYEILQYKIPKLWQIPVGGLGMHGLLGQNFFIFLQFLVNILPNNRFAYRHLRLAPALCKIRNPPLVKIFKRPRRCINSLTR